MDITVDIPEPESESENEATESQAFAELSEVHSDRSEEHREASEEAAEEATEAAIIAIEANGQAENAADAATAAAVAVTLSNEEIAQRLDRIPGEIAAAIAAYMAPPLEEEPLIDETGEVVPIVPDEEPVIPKKWHHNFLQGSGGIYRGGRR
jgi:hypothetical protein